MTICHSIFPSKNHHYYSIASNMPGFEHIINPLGSQGLSGTITLSQVSDTYVGLWNLSSTPEDVPENAEFFPYKNMGGNSGKGLDGRKQVPFADIAQGGKYRC